MGGNNMKYCAHCGKEMNEDANYCLSCGNTVEQEIIASSSNNYRAKKSRNYQLETILGILAIIFSLLNYIGVIIVHLFGIALGIITISMVNKDKKMNEEYSPGGYAMGIIGLILGGVALLIGLFSTTAL